MKNMMSEPVKKWNNKYEFLKICEYYLKQAFLKYVDAYVAWSEENKNNNNK